MDLELLRTGGILFLVLVASLSVHEWAHAWMADRLGDGLPRSQGRLTLNPTAHIDPVGTVLIPLVNIFLFHGAFALIGWGRPVMYDPSSFPPQRRGRCEVMVAAAGPVSNLVLALLAAVAGGLAWRVSPDTEALSAMIIRMNVALAVFNLIPLPPLDGGQILRHFTGMSELTFINISRWSGLAMLVLINLKAFQILFAYIIYFAAWPFGIVFALAAGF